MRAPFGRQLILGGSTSVSAPLQQLVGSQSYVFVGWSNGQPASHDVGPLTGEQTLTASYRAAGLTAQYFEDPGLQTQRLLRIDSTVDFDWGRGSPEESVPDSFAARWTGFVLPPVTDLYTFSTDSDAGVRLWINGFLVLDGWRRHALRRDNAIPVPLIAGAKVGIRMEFYDDEADAVARLAWSRLSQGREIIPATQLFPACVGGSCPNGLSCVAGECVAECASTCAEGQRCDSDGQCVDACKDLRCGDGKCVAGACVPRCQGVSCQPGFSCLPTTGLCEDQCNAVTCPAGQTCARGACVAACMVNGCLEAEKCDVSSGACVPRCQGVTCPAGSTCAPPTGACQDGCLTLSCPGQACLQGECRPICAVKGCESTFNCNATTGACEPKCQAITCAPGLSCRPTTGQCEDSQIDGGGETDGPTGAPADGGSDPSIDATASGLTTDGGAITDGDPGGAGGAGPTPGPDSGVEAGALPGPGAGGQGCGCDLGNAGGPRPGGGLLVLLATALIARFRRRPPQLAPTPPPRCYNG